MSYLLRCRWLVYCHQRYPRIADIDEISITIIVVLAMEAVAGRAEEAQRLAAEALEERSAKPR
jgi:hypothetical protein